MKAERLPSGSYRVRVYVGTDENGKKIKKSFTAPTRRQAEAQAAAFAVKQHGNDLQTFEALADRFMLERKSVLSPATVRGYNSILKTLKAHHGQFCEKSAYSITRSDMQIMIDRLVSDGKSPKTVANYHGFVTAVMDYFDIRPAGVLLPQKEGEKLNIPDEDTIRRVMEASKGTDIEVPILLGAFGPLRRGEIAALKWSDIEGNVIHVQRDCVLSPDHEWVFKVPKTPTSDRRIVMPPFVMDAINNIEHDGEYIFHINPNQITDKFRRLLSKEGIPHFRFHDLRHFCCSYLHGLKIPDMYIMQRTGHSTDTTLRRVYTHTLQNQSKIETQKMLTGFDSFN